MYGSASGTARLYSVSEPSRLRALYDSWAEKYDADALAYGQVSHGRVAAALADLRTPGYLPILDFGCGTGLTGHALAEQGFRNIHGVDVSASMLAVSRAKGQYRSLLQVEADQPLPFDSGTFEAIVACGVIGVGGVPAGTLDILANCLEPGQLLVFTYCDPSLDTPSYTDHLDALLSSGVLKMVFAEYGAHLSQMGIKASVFICEKCAAEDVRSI